MWVVFFLFQDVPLSSFTRCTLQIDEFVCWKGQDCPISRIYVRSPSILQPTSFQGMGCEYYSFEHWISVKYTFVGSVSRHHHSSSTWVIWQAFAKQLSSARLVFRQFNHPGMIKGCLGLMQKAPEDEVERSVHDLPHAFHILPFLQVLCLHSNRRVYRVRYRRMRRLVGRCEIDKWRFSEAIPILSLSVVDCIVRRNSETS